MSRTRITAALCLAATLAAGCQRRDKTEKGMTFEHEPTRFTLLVVADIDVVKNNPKAYDFVIAALDRYGSDRMGENDQVIISQISGNNRPVLFQGTPQQLRRDMPSQEEFRNYLLSRSDPGRRLHDGLTESFNYLMKTRSVAQGGAKPVALIISSLNEGEAESAGCQERFIQALINFHRAGGQMAFYFCDQRRSAWLEEQTAKAGMQWTHYELDAHGRPPLPSFE